MTPSPMAVLLFSATVLVVQAITLAWWAQRAQTVQSTRGPKTLSLLLVAIQLLVFGVTACMTGVSVVAQGTGLDEFTHTQAVLVGALLISAVGWLFCGQRANKLMKTN